MKIFVVLVCGRNLIVRFADGPRRMGLYTARVVSANSEADAIAAAIDLVKNDDELKAALVEADGHCGEFTGEVGREVDRLPSESETRTGFIYFEEVNTN